MGPLTTTAPVAEVTGACLCTSFSQRYSTERLAWVCTGCGHEEHGSRVHCGALTVVAAVNPPSREERVALIQRVLEERLLADCPDYWPDLHGWARDIVAALDA